MFLNLFLPLSSWHCSIGCILSDFAGENGVAFHLRHPIPPTPRAIFELPSEEIVLTVYGELVALPYSRCMATIMHALYLSKIVFFACIRFSG